MIHVVTIKDKIQLYKGEEPANAIEVVQLEEFHFEVVSAKDRFQVGDRALLVEPDYNLPDTDFWKDWTAPNGDPKKSKLGSHNRIRAVKFNLHRGDGQPVGGLPARSRHGDPDPAGADQIRGVSLSERGKRHVRRRVP